MREFVIHPIGSVDSDDGSCMIRVDAPYRKALRGLEEFSHLLAVFVQGGRLRIRSFRIDGIEARKGIVACSDAGGAARLRTCVLLDLKPYLPCEDSVDGEVPSAGGPRELAVVRTRDNLFTMPSAGVVRASGGRPYLEFEGDVPIAEGAVVRVVWWFDRFDKAMYRRTTTCRPPYETSGEIGVFASRSPVRPNPIALSTVKVLRVDLALRRAYVTAIECFDGTPFAGVLAYDSASEALEDVRVSAWAKDWPRHVTFSLRADEAPDVDRLARELDRTRNPLPDFACKRKKVSAVSSVRPTGIVVRGARTNNLKGVDAFIPYGKITAIVGVSGSGKSSLAADTIAAECKRRMDCLSVQDEVPSPVAVDEMTGCLPVIRIAQRRIRANVRSMVGTFSGAASHLRCLYSKFGVRHYDNPNAVAFKVTPSTFSAFDPDARCPCCDGCGVRRVADPGLLIASPEKSLLKGASPLLGRLETFLRKPNANWTKGQVVALARRMGVDLAMPWAELPDVFRDLLLKGDRNLTVTFSYGTGGRSCETSRPLEGLLPTVERLYAEGGSSSIANRFMSEGVCPLCHGERLAGEGRLVTLCGVRYPVCEKMTFGELARFLDMVERECAAVETTAVRDAGEHVQSLRSLCAAADRLGLADIELNRRTSDLSGGETQRLKLLTAFHNHLSGLLYVFDEPSQNLGRAEYGHVAGLLRELADEGNTILMVEHNPEMISISDHVIEIGPGAGSAGGEIVGAGSYQSLLADPHTLLGQYASDPSVPRRKGARTDQGMFHVRNVCFRNLKNVSVDVAKGVLTCITGVSGSGKSSLMYGGILPQAMASKAFEDVIVVESRLVCSTPRSTVATYAGIMDDLRKRFGEVRGQELESILDTDVDSAAVRIEADCPRAAATCRLLSSNGLGYLKLGQQTMTLSGGEAARLKIVCGLGSRKRTNALYLMDEPTNGLHYSDIDRLLTLVFDLLDAGNTVIAIEHNARFLSAAERLIVLGPGSGRQGGMIIPETSQH